MELILAASVFLIVLLVFLAGYALLRGGKERSYHHVVKKYTAATTQTDDVDIRYYRKFSDIQSFHRLLSVIPAVKHLDELMQQGGVKMLAGVFILVSLVCGATAFLLGFQMSKRFDLALIPAAVGLYLPYVYLLLKRRQQRTRFEALFPDALDLMAYSLKAGHSIMASFKMVADEMAAPMGEEFGRVVEEINFGNDIETTLHNFARRVDSAELRYFVTSVIIQRETGGNLVEILEKISETIRKKFRFRERVRALTAEGKISAYILVALPFLIAMAVSVLNREYIMVLMTDPVGPYLIASAGVLMCFGVFVMFRLVQLDM
jgi:tight adherence protein B